MLVLSYDAHVCSRCACMAACRSGVDLKSALAGSKLVNKAGADIGFVDGVRQHACEVNVHS